jgi:hypothetical protein
MPAKPNRPPASSSHSALIRETAAITATIHPLEQRRHHAEDHRDQETDRDAGDAGKDTSPNRA